MEVVATGPIAGRVASVLVTATGHCLPKAPGDGPSDETMNNGFFRCRLVGTATDGTVVRGQISDKGDPGNRATVKMLCQAARALAEDRDRLPGSPGRGGVLTPATALGGVLADRLRAAGMTVKIEG